MTDNRNRRQRAIADLIRAGNFGSQEEVTAGLSKLGFSVTQATVSRDLDQLGAVKVKRGGILSYALPEQMVTTDWSASRLERILHEWLVSVEAAGNLLVLKTTPGSAHLVAAAIDQARLPEAAGTVSGDDTLLLVVRDGIEVAAVAARLREQSGQL
jgi:transcriptional regulator of arginine metabolism